MFKFALYSPLHKWKPGEPPISSFVSVAVGTYSQVDGQLLLSAELKNELEIDFEIDLLISELNELRRKAKTELKNLTAKMSSE